MRDRVAMAQEHLKAGFTLVRQTKHMVWRCPCGHTQLYDTTSNCGGSGHINALTRIRRTLRECERRTREQGR